VGGRGREVSGCFDVIGTNVRSFPRGHTKKGQHTKSEAAGTILPGLASALYKKGGGGGILT